MAQYGPLDDEWEYSWLNPNNPSFTQGNILGASNGLVNGNMFSNARKSISDAMNSLNTSGNSWFGKSGILPTAFQGLSALGGLMQAYSGLKGIGVMEEQLDNAKDAFRTQFEANKTSLGEGVRNAAATNYAMHRGTARNFNEDEQRQVADAEANRVKNSYRNYVG